MFVIVAKNPLKNELFLTREKTEWQSDKWTTTQDCALKYLNKQDADKQVASLLLSSDSVNYGFEVRKIDG